jgi:hypothetical protein
MQRRRCERGGASLASDGDGHSTACRRQIHCPHARNAGLRACQLTRMQSKTVASSGVHALRRVLLDEVVKAGVLQRRESEKIHQKARHNSLQPICTRPQAPSGGCTALVTVIAHKTSLRVVEIAVSGPTGKARASADSGSNEPGWALAPSWGRSCRTAGSRRARSSCT